MKEVKTSKRVLEVIELLRKENRYEEIFFLLRVFSLAQSIVEEVFPFESALKGLGNREDGIDYFQYRLAQREEFLKELMLPFLDTLVLDFLFEYNKEVSLLKSLSEDFTKLTRRSLN